MCTFCINSPEKLEHLYWQCNTVTDFWEQIERWIFEKCNYMINVEKKKRALLRIICYKTINNALNYILILSKYHIYKCRIKKNKYLNIVTWKNELKSFLELEKVIAIKSGCYDKFIKEWQKWLLVFNIHMTGIILAKITYY